MLERDNFTSIVKGAGILLIGLILSKILTYGYRVIIARYIGVEGYGIINIALSITSLAMIISLLGSHQGVERFVSYYMSKKNLSKVKGIILSGLKISILTSVFMLAIIFLFSEVISNNFFHNEKLIPILKIFSFGIPLFVISQILLATIRSLKKINYFVYIQNIGEGLIRLILTIILIYAGYGLFGVSIAYILTFLFSAIVAFIIIQKKITPLFNRKIKSKNMDKRILKFSLPLLISGILITLFAWTDNIMLGYFRPENVVGIYNTSLPTARLINTIPTAFAALFIPILSSLYAKKKINDIKLIYNNTTKWIFIITLPIIIPFIIFRREIIEILFGVEYIGGATSFGILTIGYFLGIFVTANIGVFNSLEKTRINLKCSFIVIILNIILNYILIQKYNLNGAAIATSISIITFSILTSIYTYKLLKIQPYRIQLIKPILIILLLIPLYFALSLIQFNDIIKIVIVFSIPGVLYILLLNITKVFDEEDLKLIELVKNRLKINK